MQQTAGGLYPDLQRVSSIRMCAKLPAAVVAERVIRGTVRLPGAADPVTKDIRKVPAAQKNLRTAGYLFQNGIQFLCLTADLMCTCKELYTDSRSQTEK